MSGHNRINSADERKRIAVTRRSTRGPLDVVEDDPLAALSSQNASAAPERSPTRAARSPAPLSPRLHDVLTSPIAKPTSPPALQKDFSFLQDASAYHVLPASNIPPPFLNAPNIPSVASPIDTLLLSGHYRLAAIAAARNLVTSTPPTDYTNLFHLLHIRLACLCLINEHALAAQEAKVFGDLNSSFYYAEEDDGGRGMHLVPWDLRILVVRLTALGYGEWRKGIMGYYELARECREAIISSSKEEDEEMWRKRLRDCGIRVANVLVEMGDLEGAGRHLASLNSDQERARDVAIMETLTWLRLGDITSARRCLSSPAPAPADDLLDGTLQALIHLADSDYTAATAAFQTLHEQFPTDAMVAQNLAVCLLYTGRIAEARALLSSLATSSQPFHSLIFNLSTVYELCTERNRDSKISLAQAMATRQRDGSVGWEVPNMTFKL